MFYQKRKFKNSKGLTLTAVYRGQDQNAPVVVMCHGYGSSKDSEANLDLSKKLVSAGIGVYRFDFSGAGESDGTTDDRTPIQGVDDLNAAVKDLEKSKFALYGNSYGGWVALEYAATNQVLALGLKCPVSSNIGISIPDPKSYGYTENSWKLFINQVGYNLYSVAKNIKAPTLIVHGDADEIVPLTQSQKLLTTLGGEKKLSIIHGADHRMESYMQDAHTQLTEFFVKKLL